MGKKLNKNVNELNELNEELDSVAGGNMCVDNVMGVSGLNVCSGHPTETNPSGWFWRRNGIAVTEEEAFKCLKKHATKRLDESVTDEYFLSQYIDDYNNRVHGHDE